MFSLPKINYLVCFKWLRNDAFKLYNKCLELDGISRLVGAVKVPESSESCHSVPYNMESLPEELLFAWYKLAYDLYQIRSNNGKISLEITCNDKGYVPYLLFKEGVRIYNPLSEFVIDWKNLTRSERLPFEFFHDDFKPSYDN